MDSAEFVHEAKKIVSKKATKLVTRLHLFNPADVRTVWLSKVLQNNKGIFIVLHEGVENICFEVTYNGTKREFYLDTYRKIENEKILLEDTE